MEPAKRRWKTMENIHHYDLIRHKSVKLGAVPFTERMSSLDFIFDFYTSSRVSTAHRRLQASIMGSNMGLCLWEGAQVKWFLPSNGHEICIERKITIVKIDRKNS